MGAKTFISTMVVVLVLGSVNTVGAFAQTGDSPAGERGATPAMRTNQAWRLPDRPGEWAVGRHTFEVVDASRDDRTLPVDLWYPADARSADAAAPSTVDLLVADLELDLARDNPAPASVGGFPLFVFSHGSGGIKEQSYFLMEWLASHGYVVVAPEHAGNTALGPSDANEVIAANRPRDISFVIDEVLAKNADTADRFTGLVDPERIAVGGHSFGGFTALAVAGGFGDYPADERVDAIVPLAAAAGGLSDDELAAITVPTLFLSSTDDQTVPLANTDRAASLVTSRRIHRVDLQKGGHNSFTNACDLLDLLADAGLPADLLASLEGSAAEACGPGLLDVDLAHRLTNRYTLHFLDSVFERTTRTKFIRPRRILSPEFAQARNLPIDITETSTLRSFLTNGTIREYVEKIAQAIRDLTPVGGPSCESTGCAADPATSVSTDRPAAVTLPSDYDPAKEYPLVVLLHGFGATGAVQSAYFRVPDQVDERDFILVAPDGRTNSQGRQFWNATPVCCDGERTGVDDVAYLRSVIDEAKTIYNIDTGRVYLWGHSNGGYMSMTMACQASDVITAVASLAGSSFADVADCAPRTDPVGVLLIHGDNDETVSYEDTQFGTPGAVSLAKRHAGFLGCDADNPREGDRLDLDNATDGLDTSVLIFDQDCDGDQYVELRTIEGGPHIPNFTADWAPTTLDWLLAQSR